MNPPDPTPKDLFSAADQAAAGGDLAHAAELLEAALAGDGQWFEGWLKLAGLRRALKQPRKALAAVHSALEIHPMDFIALSLKAALLEKLAPESAGEAWSEALAQRPSGEVPAGMAGVVARGEEWRRRWEMQREERLIEATAAQAKEISTDEAWKIERFRNNVLRKTRIWHSEPTHYHYPGLIEREFHPHERFPWLPEVEVATSEIAEELRAMLHSSRAELVPYLDYAEHEALAQWRELNRNPDWTAIHLIKRGEVVEANAVLCPRTMSVLARVPQPQIPGASANAMFSLLAPGKKIPPHVGVNNTRLLCHLPLIVPEGCWFRVGGETRNWREGEAFVFDDTIEHEAANPSDKLRIVMIFDIWHPDLTPLEQDAIAALVAADGARDFGL